MAQIFTHLPIKDFFEAMAWRRQQLVCGIDEVGRGCLAGPVVTCAAILPRDTPQDFQDSKKLTPRQREQAFTWLTKHAAYSIAFGSHHLIDTSNIYQATRLTMRRACLQLAAQHAASFQQLACIVVDAMPLSLPVPSCPPIYSFIQGEDRSRSIAAASIIAKVTRDRLLERIGPLFPSFGLERNKAYATAEHQQAIRQGHSSLIHRKTFTLSQPR